MYRALFARGPRLTTREGEPTHGVYFFTRMLLKLLNSKKPDFFVVTMDGKRSALERRKLYPPYKTNRRKKSPGEEKEMFGQIDRMLEILKALKVAVLYAKGWEADDLIATLVTEFGAGLQTVIVSSDKDLHQLVDDHVWCYDPAKEEYTKPADVRAKWGVGPEQVTEVQTLMGDSTDNIPGVKGVGPKLAATWIEKYGTVENLLEYAGDDLTEAKYKALQETDLDLMRKLVTLRRDIDLGNLKLVTLPGQVSLEDARDVFQELGFKRLVAQPVRRKRREGFFQEER